MPAEQRVGDRARLLVDLLAHEPVVAVLLGGRQVPVDVVAACPRRASPSKSVTSTPSRVIVTTWSWPSSSASRVCSMNAATSEPRKFSPSPSPTTSGELRRAATTRSGSWRVDGDQGERALEPAAHRAASPRSGPRRRRPRPRAGARRPRCRSRRAARGRRASSSARSSAKFSMMPLCTRATRPVCAEVRVRVDVVGGAVGGPAGVADAGGGPAAAASSAIAFSRLASLPARLSEASAPVVRPARSRRSRSRGTPAGAGPRSRRPGPAWSPTYPTIPHMGAHSIGGAVRTGARSTPATMRRMAPAARRRQPDGRGVLAVRRARPRRLGRPSAHAGRAARSPPRRSPGCAASATQLDLDEVQQVYLPLSRLLSLYVESRRPRCTARRRSSCTSRSRRARRS